MHNDGQHTELLGSDGPKKKQWDLIEAEGLTVMEIAHPNCPKCLKLMIFKRLIVPDAVYEGQDVYRCHNCAVDLMRHAFADNPAQPL